MLDPPIEYLILFYFPRIGIQALTRFLRPLVEKNLKSVLLFGSIENEQKVWGSFFHMIPAVALAITYFHRRMPSDRSQPPQIIQ